jgi:hypothetical protein
MDDRALRSEISRHLDHRAAILTTNETATEFVSFDIGAPKAIDRLLRIADKEKRSRPQLRAFPSRRALLCRSDREQDFVLNTVCVLKFVNQNVAVAPSNRQTHLIMVAHERPDVNQEVVEIEDGCRALAGLISLQQLVKRARQRANKCARDVADKLVPRVICGFI